MKLESVLLVDDDQICNYLHKTILKRMDKAIEVTVCHNGNSAMECLRKRLKESTPLPSLILLDIHMPVMDGFGFLKNMLSYPDLAKIPVIIVSSSCANIDMSKIRELGNFPCICKPLLTQDLIEALKAINYTYKNTTLENKIVPS